MPYFFEKKLVSFFCFCVVFFFCFFLGRVLTGEYQGNWGLRVFFFFCFFFFLYQWKRWLPTYTQIKRKDTQKKSREAVSNTSSDFFFLCVCQCGCIRFFFSSHMRELLCVRACECMWVHGGVWRCVCRAFVVGVCVCEPELLFSLFLFSFFFLFFFWTLLSARIRKGRKMKVIEEWSSD